MLLYKKKIREDEIKLNEVLVNETNTSNTSTGLHRLPLTFTLSF